MIYKEAGDQRPASYFYTRFAGLCYIEVILIRISQWFNYVLLEIKCYIIQTLKMWDKNPKSFTVNFGVMFL